MLGLSGLGSDAVFRFCRPGASKAWLRLPDLLTMWQVPGYSGAMWSKPIPLRRMALLVLVTVALVATGFAHRMPTPDSQALEIALANGLTAADLCGDTAPTSSCRTTSWPARLPERRTCLPHWAICRTLTLSSWPRSPPRAKAGWFRVSLIRPTAHKARPSPDGGVMILP